MVLTAVLCYYNKTSDIINLQEKNVYLAHGFGNSSQKPTETPRSGQVGTGLNRSEPAGTGLSQSETV